VVAIRTTWCDVKELYVLFIQCLMCFVLLLQQLETVCRVFISVFNQLDAQNLFHNKIYFIPLHVASTCAHHQEVKIAL